MPDLDAISHVSIVYGPVVLFVIATFLILETIFVGIARRRREHREINARLRAVARTADGEAALVELRRSRGMTAEGAYQLPFLAFNRLLIQSGVSISAHHLLALMTAVGLIAGLLAYNLTSLLPIALLATAIVGVLIPVFVLVIKRSRRTKRLEGQLPEAIDVMVRSLRAGHPLPVAIAMVAREMPDPIGSEFGIVVDEVTYGADLRDALQAMAERWDMDDMRMFVVSLSIQSETGGNLAEILENLARVIRERASMMLKVRALSSEGRMTAVMLTALPVLSFTILFTFNPKFYLDVSDDPAFVPGFLGLLLMYTIGFISIRRMVNLKV